MLSDVFLECPLCVDLFQSPTVILPCCANSVCAACVQSWLGRTSECPICRESLGEELRNCVSWVRNRQLEAVCDNIRTARYNEAKERQSLGVTRRSSSSTAPPVASTKTDTSQCKCIICFDHHAPQLGISCSSRTTEPHFICKSCFPPLVLSLCQDQSKLLDHGFEIRCPYPECSSSPFDCSVVTSMLLRDRDSTEASVQEGKSSVFECSGSEAARVGRTRARARDSTVRSRKDSGDVPLPVSTATTLVFGAAMPEFGEVSDEANEKPPLSEALEPDLEVEVEGEKEELEAEPEAKLEAPAGPTPPQKVVLDQYISALVSAATRSSLKHKMQGAKWHLGPSTVGNGDGGGGGANHGANSRSQSPGINDFGSGAGSPSAFSLISSPLPLEATAGNRSSFAPYDMDRLCQLVEENLNAQCPASFCRAVLDQSPDGCCAMRCTQCGTHFCWLCGAISPCSGSTHSHVRRCVESPQPGSVFLPQRDVDAALRQQRLMALRRALGTTLGPRWAADSRLRRLVRENGRLVGALKDCGISVADLFDSLIISAQQRLAAAGGGAGAGPGGAGGEGGLANPGGWFGLRAILWGGARGDRRHAGGAHRGLWLDGRAVAVVVAFSCLVQYAGLDVFGFFGRVFGRVASGSTALTFALLQRVCEWTAQRGAAVSLRVAHGVLTYGPVVFSTIFELSWASLWAVGVATWVVFVYTVKAIWLFLGLVNNVIR